MGHDSTDGRSKGVLERMHKYLLLLAILAATVTYNAGLNPPGGFWADDGEDHRAGDPMLQVTKPFTYLSQPTCGLLYFDAHLVS